MESFELKKIIKELLIKFHSSELPELIERDIEIPEFKKINKIIVTIGPRRAGKTYFLYQIMKKRIKKGNTLKDFIYLNFENENLSELKPNQLNLILEAYAELYGEKKPILFLDEIQNIPNWDKFIRRLNDENYLTYISGSNSKFLSKEIATALRGRDYPVQVLPFSFKEFINFKGIKLEKNWEFSKTKLQVKRAFEEYFSLSGFPEIILENKLELIDQYFKTMLFQDIIERYAIKNTDLMRLLMLFLARHYGGNYSLNKFNNFAKSNSYKSSTSVIQKYSKILEDIYFSFFITAKQKSMKKESNYQKKAYLYDHAFANYYGEENKGRLLENIVAIELMRRQDKVNHYTNGFECDFITTKHSIQVCYALNQENQKREMQGLIEATKKFKNKPILITFDQETQIQKINTKPIWKWLLEK
ncbi:MAG: hypothetical protein COV47_01140 [Candidatus Diapherotrites archaeon CG11_big_fil_rev_8_21_14_0_20_37_9]|nr:MAG: hypothetical protein COV47_01140 [Candidatus Diapherotrites archaeon CG11_big_fil_rev_8_21_14_0_20_37_9]